ncbi:CDP-alcohol phosphatidyltransferase family protein [Rhizobium rhizosphaerae]|uniref:CDP-alcohol phosphatidyltransferase family protein n=1 Tax=Xaviernesmea rhizosphaerae TaxID=1672749 RepID=UPI001FD93CFD|nr:CDP-alcohol phosphatidyltransferase family protein [Xaviernesmea rhizosphaerae]
MSRPAPLVKGELTLGTAGRFWDWIGPPPGRDALFDDSLTILSSLLAGTAVVAGAATFLPHFDWTFVAWVLAPLAWIYLLTLRGLRAYPHDRFGPANVVTAFRAALVCLVAATFFRFQGLAHEQAMLWCLVATVVVTLALDGVDGYLARRFRQESAFGARFDMEVDAFFILILSGAALFLHKAGPWVLLIGLMRYGFVAAGWFVPRLNGPLFPSLRRKAVCVLQIACLCAILMPIVAPPLSSAIAAAALGGLVYSFAVDIRFLLSWTTTG